MANKGLGGFLQDIGNTTRAVNDTTKTVNNVKQTTQGVSRAVGGGGIKLPTLGKKKDTSWTCECGLTNTAKFCGGCGKPAPTELKCPKCKWKRPIEKSNLKFCEKCGTKLEE